MNPDIDVHDLKRLRDAQADHILLDVREDDELATASLPGAMHIPMAEVPSRLDELPRDRDIVVMCHGGRRSARVADFLRDQGYTRVANLEGGIDAWSTEIDPAIPRY